MHTRTNMMRRILAAAGMAAALAASPTIRPRVEAAAPHVALVRVPSAGIQPVAEVDAAGTMHLIYFAGDSSAGDVFYVTRRAGASGFSGPVRVNSQAGSVIATGTVRGAQLALGRNGRVHVAWMGSGKAEPRGPGGESPMLYARSALSRAGFEKQRNVVRHGYGLDGGGTVAADTRGNVYVVWHAGDPHKGEEHRRVWIATSADDGATFTPETAATAPDAGTCGCCGITALVDPRGALQMLYRAFSPPDHRDMYLLTSGRPGAATERRLLEKWQLSACPMSTSSMTNAGGRLVMAWETNGQVSWAFVDKSGPSAAVAAPGTGTTRKHPAIAMAGGQVLLAWTEGMAWKRGGTLHWQEFDAQGKPNHVRGSAPDVPVWSRPAVVANGQGGFSITY